MYIHEKEDWTNFYWNQDEIALPLDEVTRAQGKLYGRLEGLGFESQLKATAENLLADIVGSSEIEGIRLNTDEVRSSIAKKLGIKNIKDTPSSHYVDSVVNVMLDATEHYDRPLSKEQLCAWQAAFFPSGTSEGRIIEAGMYRTGEEYIVSGMFGREKIHYIAPAPQRVDEEMQKFIHWFNGPHKISQILCSAIAHIWFVTIHPFEDGNGRLSRILADILLARADGCHFRFYNISSEINRNKKHYYDIIERVQRGDGDLTEWLLWYLETLQKAINNAHAAMSTTLSKSFFWMHFAETVMTDRQKNTLNLFLDGYEAKITSKNWAGINKCSRDTANRDIADLVEKQVLVIDNPEAKRPVYSINYNGTSTDIPSQFSDVRIAQKGEESYLSAIYRGKRVCERILRLDAERVDKGEIVPQQLIGKYLSYLTSE
ncbi:MAG: Fic family protein [Bacteroidales bacterium]|nr:Fic family protein [Bacteroidales bacterium]